MIPFFAWCELALAAHRTAERSWYQRLAFDVITAMEQSSATWSDECIVTSCQIERWQQLRPGSLVIPALPFYLAIVVADTAKQLQSTALRHTGCRPQASYG